MKKTVYEFWDWVEQRMMERDIPSYRQLEAAAGFANGAISRRKNDVKLPTVEMAEGLCHALRVGWCELWAQAGLVSEATREGRVMGVDAEILREIDGTSEAFRRGVVEMIRLMKAVRAPEGAFSVNEPGPDYSIEEGDDDGGDGGDELG